MMENEPDAGERDLITSGGVTCCGFKKLLSCLGLRTKQDQDTGVQDGNLPAETLMPYLKAHGRHSLAYSSVQEGICHFLLEGIGFIAYTHTHQPAWSKVLVLGDPVAHKSRWPDLVKVFILHHKRAQFMHISHEFGKVLSDVLNYEVNCMGGETQLIVPEYTFVGKTGRAVRLDAQRAQRMGMTVEEIPRVSPEMAVNPEMAAQLRQVSEEWIQAKGTIAKQAWFMLRPPVFEKEAEGTRIFVAWAPLPCGSDKASSMGATCLVTAEPDSQKPSSLALSSHRLSSSDDGSVESGSCSRDPGTSRTLTSSTLSTNMNERVIVGFLVLDPMHEDGKIVGYLRNIVRTSNIAHPATVSLMTKAVVDTLRAEHQRVEESGKVPGKELVEQTHEVVDSPHDMTRSARKAAARRARREAEAKAAAHKLVASPQCPAQVRSTNACQKSAGPGLVLSLGLSPAYCVKEDTKTFRYNIWVHKLNEWLWRHGDAFYPFTGLAASKARYGGGSRALEATGQYPDPAVRWLPCWEASGARGIALWEQYQMGRTTGLVHALSEVMFVYIKKKSNKSKDS